MLTEAEVSYFRLHQDEITSDLLSALRALGKTGKQQALDILDMPKDADGYYLDAFGKKVSFNGDKTQKPLHTKFKYHDIHLTEIEKCKSDIHYFIQNYVKIMTPKNGIDFVDNRDYQNRFLSLLADENAQYILGLLPRQSGKSVTTGCWLAWSFCFEREINIGVCSMQTKQSAEFLSKCKNVIELLPIWMKPGLRVWNVQSIKSENETKIMTSATNESSFRGDTVNYIICDEADWIKNSDFLAMRDSLLPAQAALAKKKTLFITTPNGKQQFYEMWVDAGYSAEESKNGYIKFDVDWRTIPRYKNDGTLWDPEEFKQFTIKKDGLQFWMQNFECSFIGSAHTLISGETLNNYKIKAPIDVDLKGQIKIYEEPIPDHKYIMGVDSSKEGQDFTAIQIFDISGLKFNQVFSAKLKIDYLMVPEILNEYGLKFNQCLIIIENNEGSGQSIADIMAREYEYPNLFYEYKSETGGIRSVRKRYAYPGFRTTRQSRDLLLQVIRMLAENNRLNLCDAETIREFETFILYNGKYQASGKAHDDLVMACMICFAMFKDTKDFEDVLKIVEGIKSGESLDVSLIGYSGFSDFGDFDSEDPHKDFDNYDIWREQNEYNESEEDSTEGWF